MATNGYAAAWKQRQVNCENGAVFCGREIVLSNSWRDFRVYELLPIKIQGEHTVRSRFFSRAELLPPGRRRATSAKRFTSPGGIPMDRVAWIVAPYLEVR